MKGLAALVRWIDRLNAIREAAAQWEGLSSSPYTRLEDLKDCERRIGWNILEMLPQ